MVGGPLPTAYSNEPTVNNRNARARPPAAGAVFRTKKSMKKNALFVLIGSLLALAVFSVRAQTDTNVDFLTLNFNISLTAYTNGIAETNGNLATATPGRVRITTKDVIQALSNHVVFPILTRTNPNGVAVPYDGPAVMTNFSRTAKLVILQGLGTNHGVFFIAWQPAVHQAKAQSGKLPPPQLFEEFDDRGGRRAMVVLGWLVVLVDA